ncbi:hypothetical protein GCM10017673_47570 [Streptosporangium violaceochromogenes]|nr:hypothetical protein GCM10017673_47570 [Streptosporangium violaceochromogenes]
MQVWPSSVADAQGAPPWPAATGEPVWPDTGEPVWPDTGEPVRSGTAEAAWSGTGEAAPRPAEPGDVPVWPPSAIPQGGSGESTVTVHASGPAVPPRREPADHPPVPEPDGSGLTAQASPTGTAAGDATPPAEAYAATTGTAPPTPHSPASSVSPAVPGRTPGALPEAEGSPEPAPSPEAETGHAPEAAASPSPGTGHGADPTPSRGVEHSAGPPLPRRRPQSFSQATANSPGFSRQPARPSSPQDPSPTQDLPLSQDPSPAQGTASAQGRSPEPVPQPGAPAQPTGPALTAQGPLPRSEPMPQTPVPPAPGSPFPPPPADRGAPVPLRASRERQASPDDIPVLSVSFPPTPAASSPDTTSSGSSAPTPAPTPASGSGSGSGSGEVVPRGPFTPVSAAVVKATPAPPPPPSGRGRGGTLLIAAVVLLVIGGIGAGAFLAYRSFTAKQVASAPAPVPTSPLDFTEEPTTPTEPDPVNTEMLNSERTDPGRMTVADSFPKKVTVNGITFARVKTDLATKCQEAAAGRFAGMLKSQECRQVLRATYVDGDRKYAVTTGVAMLPTRESAVAADRAKDLNDNVWFRGLPGPTGSGAERVHIAGGYASGLVWGRYIVFSYATFGDGHTPTPKERFLGKISGAFRDETAKVVERRVTN